MVNFEMFVGLATVYRVQMVDGAYGPRPKHLWSRTYQIEWPGCQKAVRTFTDYGAWRRGYRAWLEEC